jgi:hypothetical protein
MVSEVAESYPSVPKLTGLEKKIKEAKRNNHP